MCVRTCVRIRVHTRARTVRTRSIFNLGSGLAADRQFQVISDPSHAYPSLPFDTRRTPRVNVFYMLSSLMDRKLPWKMKMAIHSFRTTSRLFVFDSMYLCWFADFVVLSCNEKIKIMSNNITFYSFKHHKLEWILSPSWVVVIGNCCQYKNWNRSNIVILEKVVAKTSFLNLNVLVSLYKSFISLIWLPLISIIPSPRLYW